MTDDATPQFAPQFQLASHYSFHPMTQHDFGIAAADLPQQQRQPGAWYYETGSNPDDGIGSGSASTGISGDVSPIAELMGDFNALSPHQLAAPGRHVTVSVEVPSSEHVAEIVGRQGN